MNKIVPEFYLPVETPRGAGFVPGDGVEEVSLWQLWCKSGESDDARRATVADLRKAGFVKRKKKPVPPLQAKRKR